jgi:septal ring factor EnvC (AmiA/AmiB activator)
VPSILKHLQQQQQQQQGLGEHTDNASGWLHDMPAAAAAAEPAAEAAAESSEQRQRQGAASSNMLYTLARCEPQLM